MKICKFSAVLVLGAVLLISTSAMAFTVLVGDKDGYGCGAPDVGTGVVLPMPSYPPPPGYDGRSVAEKAATNGAQITDCYSAIFPDYGPNNFTTASVIFPLPQAMTSATLTVAMGDFQASEFGPIAVNYNGIVENWAFQDGFQVTTVRTFTLTPTEVAAANLAGQMVVNLDHINSGDFIAFDWFQLDATPAVPVPPTVWLMGSGLLGMIGWRRFRKG